MVINVLKFVIDVSMLMRMKEVMADERLYILVSPYPPSLPYSQA